MNGRIARAKAGLPWCGERLTGRGFDEANRRWYVNDRGREIADMLKRYAEGASVTTLGREYEKRHGLKFNSPHYFKTLFHKWVHKAQLTGPYTVHFKSPDIDLDETVVVPGIPDVVSPALLAKVKARLAHNTRFNRTDAAKWYPLSGFINCARCGRALSGQTTTPAMGSLVYYRHDNQECPAPWMSVRGEKLSEVVLDYLYGFFLDEPAFNRAVQKALPSNEQRDELTQRRDAAARRLAKVDKQIENLIAAVAKGADPDLIIKKQTALKAEQEHHRAELEQLNDQLATLPSAEQIGQAAMWCRLDLMRQHMGKNWRKLSPDEIKRFLHHLFGENPRQTGTGIFVDKDSKSNLTVTFKGRVEIPHRVGIVDGRGRVVSAALDREAKRLSRQLRAIASDFRFSTE